MTSTSVQIHASKELLTTTELLWDALMALSRIAPTGGSSTEPAAADPRSKFDRTISPQGGHQCSRINILLISIGTIAKKMVKAKKDMRMYHAMVFARWILLSKIKDDDTGLKSQLSEMSRCIFL
jgi:hypothetical protein